MIEVEIEDPAWSAVLPDAAWIVERAAEATLDAIAPSEVEAPLVAVLLADDAAVAELNERFRGKAGPTNVLSFPAAANPEGQIGDIALAYGVCAREAAEQGKTLEQHLIHLTTHGVLHLLGYDHETDSEAEAMEALERSILETLGVPDPYACERARRPQAMSTDDQSSPTEPHAPQSRGMRAMLRRFRKGLKGEDRHGHHHGEGPPTPGTGVDIVDQAEAFKTLRVEDVMTPRADINALDITTEFEEVVRCFAEHEHSRMPVYRDTLDDPVGVVNVKDVFKLLANGPAPQANDPVLHRLRREVLYVPASMRAADLLLRMQGSRIHMALVIDEFGGTDGLVSMEDLIEAVVGDISDEYDEAVPAHIVARPGGLFEADARASLEEFEAALGEPVASEDLEEEIDTVGGLVGALAGRVPQRGEVISHPGGFEFEVTDSDPRRVKHVRIRRLERPSEAMTAAAPKPADEV